MSKNYILIIAILLVVLCSCVSNRLEIQTFSDSSRGKYYLNVPFVPQKQEGYCGPVALATVLNYWKDPIEQDQIAKSTYLPSVKGSLSFDLVQYARKRGFDAELYFGDLQDITDKIRLGYPLIAILGNNTNTAGHYIVVVGYDDKKHRIFVHEEKSPYGEISYKKFLSLWKNTDNLTILIIPQR